MLSAIQSIVGPLVNISTVSSSAANDVFEAYVLSLIVRAACEEGAIVSYVDRDGIAATSLTFRTSPGQIYSTAKNYSHVMIEFPNLPVLEAHIGIKIAGKSGVLHEADIAVLDRAEAENCRRNSVSPRSSKVIVAVECKYYTSALQLHLARSFIGLISDLSSKDPFFVTNTSANSVEKLLSHRVKHWEKNITPSCSNNEIDRLAYSFRDAFKNFKAR